MAIIAKDVQVGDVLEEDSGNGHQILVLHVEVDVGTTSIWWMRTKLPSDWLYESETLFQVVGPWPAGTYEELEWHRKGEH